MLENYFAILVFLAAAFCVGLLALGLNFFLAPRQASASKSAPYECGFDAFDQARAPFNVRFYLIAILFIVFDLETAFFFPWCLVLKKIGWFGFGAMCCFVLLLGIGFLYEWCKGALEWE